ILDVRRAGGVPPGTQGPPLTGGLTLTPRQVDDHLVVVLGGRNIQNVDQEPLGIAVDRLGPRSGLPRNGPGPTAADDPPIPRGRSWGRSWSNPAPFRAARNTDNASTAGGAILGISQPGWTGTNARQALTAHVHPQIQIHAREWFMMGIRLQARAW